MDEGRATFLESLPKGNYFTPCKCSTVHGYTLDRDKDMWVCGSCRNPAGTHRGYSPFCIFCGDPFTLEKYEPQEYPQCPKCNED